MTGARLLSRDEFREQCLERDSGQCLVPWCDREADEVHHIIERGLWDDGGSYMRNGASVCNPHHRYAESNDIPPQAFWYWLDCEPLTPDGVPAHVNKWGPDGASDGRGETFEEPAWKEHRERIKYPSTGHLPFSPEWDDTRADHRSVEPFLNIPLVCTVKMDGGNCMMVKDDENPVRARNGQHADHESFDRLKQLYWEENLYSTIPEHIQVFGENLVAKHSIHYGCDCEPACEDVGPALDAYFEVFGVYDTRYDIWLGWPEVEEWADRLGFPTTPVLRKSHDDVEEVPFEREHELYETLEPLARRVVDDGHEGIVIRSKFPFHFGQFGRRLGKYVRDGHVDPDAEHWSKRELVENRLAESGD